MFTGLVEAVGEIVGSTATAGGLRLRIVTGLQIFSHCFGGEEVMSTLEVVGIGISPDHRFRTWRRLGQKEPVVIGQREIRADQDRLVVIVDRGIGFALVAIGQTPIVESQ